MSNNFDPAKALLVWSRKPTDEKESLEVGRVILDTHQNAKPLQVFEVFETEQFLSDEERRVQVAEAICAHLQTQPSDTEVFVLFHSFVKKDNIPFIHAQLGLVDELLKRLPERVHLAVLGTKHDAELRENMERVLEQKRRQHGSDAKVPQYPLLNLTFDQLGWVDVQELREPADKPGADLQGAGTKDPVVDTGSAHV